MTFTSLSFFLFLPFVFLAWHATKLRHRWLVLLVASYGFYGSFKAPWLLVVLAAITAISYACGLKLKADAPPPVRQAYFWSGSCACIALLVVAKCLPILKLSNNFSLTIGISYFTFQAISYLTDVYLEIEEPEQDAGYLALYLAFFPKLLQGPIERAGDLLPQLRKPAVLDYQAVREGMLLFGWGLFKKIVIANRLAIPVDRVFGDIHAFSGLPLAAAVFLYALQIYFDFSGYTDMALGSARLFNIRLTQNFNSPYFATSIADFWRRWHISFSRWILDYIFKPLQMTWRDWKTGGTAAALMVTFFVSGLWHGISWGFIVWGLLHGMYLAGSSIYRPYQKRIHAALGIEKSAVAKLWQIPLTFGMVCFAWIFFRADSLADALYVVAHLFETTVRMPVGGMWSSRECLVALCLLLIPALVAGAKKRCILFEQPLWIRWSVYYSLATILILFSQFSGSFIYFRF